MKIALVGPAHPFRGGIAALNERLVKALQDEGHQCFLFNFTTQYPNFLFPGKSQFTDSAQPVHLQMMRSLSSVNPISWYKTSKAILDYQPDLVIYRYWIPFMAPALGSVARLVSRVNPQIHQLCIADNIIPHEKRIGDRQLTTYFTKAMHSFLYMSKSVGHDLKHFAPHALSTYNPHPLYDHYGSIIPRAEACERLELSPDYRYLLFFGLIRDYKGLDWLLEAYKASALSKKKVKLLIAGEFYSKKESTMYLIQNLGIEEHIVLHDYFISDDRINAYFCASDMVVQPYKSATQSGVTQIAYHFERPMLVTNVGGLSEIVTDGVSGYVTEPAVSSIQQALIDFYEQQRQTVFEEGVKDEKDRFSWDKMVRAIEELTCN